MYIPKHWHWVGPVGTVLTGFYINQQLGAGWHWDVILLVQAPLDVIAVQWGAYIWQAGVAYQKYVTGSNDRPTEPTVPAEKRRVPVFVDGQEWFPDDQQKPQMQQAVDQPILSSEVMVAKQLIVQRNSNLKIDLTEGYWLRGNPVRFPDGQPKFKAMLGKWEFHSMIQKGNFKTARYEVVDWRKVRLVSTGHALPPPPPNWRVLGAKP